MPNRKRTETDDFEEIQHIREDISSLKTNVVALTRHLKENGEHRVDSLERRAEEKLRNGLEKVEKQVKANPGQSLTMAFCAGVLLNYFLDRR